MKITTPQGHIIYTDLRTQVGTIGKEFRLSSVIKNTQIPPKWINNTEKHHWFYLFRYIDSDNFFKIEVDYFNKFARFVSN